MDLVKRYRAWIASVVLVLLLLGGYQLLFAPPRAFPSGNIVIIATGTPASRAAEELSAAHIIAHPSILSLVLRLGMASEHIQSGAYLFAGPQDVFVVAYRIATGAFGIPAARLTFVEGTTVIDMATEVADAIPTISADDFMSAASPSEGYLFPDTYLFSPGTDATAIVKTMRDRFDKQIAPLQSDIRASSHSLADIISMASLIEKEARTTEARRMISGILWNRFAINMPLQVDVASSTYSRFGLPATPICNPGLDAIEAALYPTKTQYLYYLTDKNGVMHYATTFAGHQANVRKYLN